MTILNDVQIKLAEQLLLSVKNKEMNIEYNELAERITPPIHWRQVGKNIGEISKLCHELGLPLISAKVVNRNTHKAGDGFYPLYEMLGISTEGKTEQELFRQEREAIRNCKEWYKLEDYLGLNVGMPRPEGTSFQLSLSTISDPASTHSEWIFPCNLSTYNIHQAYANLRRIDWKQSCNISPGDIVYIYIAAPEKRIAYKCIAIKTNKPASTIDDSPYAIRPEHFANYGRYVELQFVYHFVEADTSYATLRLHGLSSSLQSPVKIAGELLDFLRKSVDNDKFAVRIAVGMEGKSVYVNHPQHSAKTLNSNAPDLYDHSVDVLNTCFGTSYLDRFHDGFQQSTKCFSAAGTNYIVWFPIFSSGGEAVSSHGWINILTDNGNTIIEEASSKTPNLGYDDNGSVRLVFAKNKNLPYMFIGAFEYNRSASTSRKHVFYKVANIADFSHNPPVIEYFRNDAEQDDTLVSVVNQDGLSDAPNSFTYVGTAKKKADPVIISGRKTFPRNRQTAINALAHAEYTCEIDSAHPTFLRRNSDKPYTEPHHLIPMAYSDDYAVSLDVEENIVSLCSNCHNEIHYGRDANKLITKLFNERKDALKKVGITITLSQLLAYYEGL